MTDLTINIAKDFTEYPGGRYRKHGKGSGEEFRDGILIPALKTGNKVTVFIEGTSGYPSSFLEETFGGLVRAGLSAKELKKHLSIETRDPVFRTYVNLAWHFIEEQDRKASVAS